MNNLALIAEIGAAIAVLISVIYLAFQVRDGSRSNRAAAVATLLNQYDSPNSVLAANTDAARVFRLGFEGSNELNADETVQFQAMCVQYLTVYHTAYRFHRDGILGDEHWAVFRRDLAEFTDYPGMLALKAYFLAYYSPDPEFAEELRDIYEERVDSSDDAKFFDSMKGKI